MKFIYVVKDELQDNVYYSREVEAQSWLDVVTHIKLRLQETLVMIELDIPVSPDSKLIGD